MVVKYQGEFLHSSDEPLDLGYEAPNVVVEDFDSSKLEVGGYKKLPQLIVSLPFLNEDILVEVKEIEAQISQFIEKKVVTTIVLNDRSCYKLKDEYKGKFGIVFDIQEEFGNYYGVRISNGSLKGKLFKAVFVVSKDGSLFYDEVVENLEDRLDVDKLIAKVVSTISQYTGVGCHG